MACADSQLLLLFERASSSKLQQASNRAIEQAPVGASKCQQVARRSCGILRRCNSHRWLKPRSLSCSLLLLLLLRSVQYYPYPLFNKLSGCCSFTSTLLSNSGRLCYSSWNMGQNRIPRHQIKNKTQGEIETCRWVRISCTTDVIYWEQRGEKLPPTQLTMHIAAVVNETYILPRIRCSYERLINTLYLYKLVYVKCM